jgi:hypothetical protein
MHRYRMKTTFLDRLLGIADEWLRPFASVTPDPAGDEPGGGGGGDGLSDDDDGEIDASVGEAGRTAIQREREQRKALARELAQMKSQLEAVRGINPEAYREAQRQAEELARQLRDRDAATAADRLRIEGKAQKAVTEARQAAEQERQRRIDLEVRTRARTVFDAAGGRQESDGDRSYFDDFMDSHGKRHFRTDENGRLYVVDSDGDRIKTADGKDVDPVEWLNERADNSPVVGNYFRAKGGEGSGGLSGARGIRGQNRLTPEAARSAKPGQLLDRHYGDTRRR